MRMSELIVTMINQGDPDHSCFTTHLIEVLAKPKSGIKLVLGFGCDAGPRCMRETRTSQLSTREARSCFAYLFDGKSMQIKQIRV
jgi:hypothetical protein